METELKRLVDEVAMETLDKLPLIESVTLDRPLTDQLVSVYFDTPELDLRRAGMRLRVRHVDGKRL